MNGAALSCTILQTDIRLLEQDLHLQEALLTNGRIRLEHLQAILRLLSQDQEAIDEP